MTVGAMLRRAAAGIGGGDYLAEVLADSPLAAWMLQELAGTQAADASGNARHATYVGSPALGASGPGGGLAYAMNPDGTNDYVALPTLPFSGTTSPQSFEVVLNLASTVNSSSANILPWGTSESGAYVIGLGNITGTINNEVLSLGSGGFTAWLGFSIPAGWHHIAFTYSGTRNTGWNAYLDGVDVDTLPGVTRASASSGALGFASTRSFYLARSYTVYTAFPGLAGAACYDSELSAARVLAHADALGLAA